MPNTSLQLSKKDEHGGRGVHYPVLPGRTPQTHGVDTTCESYKAGYRDASIGMAEDKADRERRHEAFADSVGAMLAEIEERYRAEALSLIGRLFAAAAPRLARNNALEDVMAIAQERVMKSDDVLTLRVHPDLIAHLSEQNQKSLNEKQSIRLIVDETCAPASIDARWSKGGFVSNPETLIQEILNALGCETECSKESDDE
ncbi:hypothetical protein [Hyphococcus sp.]|uniref:hypothetical protein n=1 Tax=Hyphococcus sp. TaxID=2038636 RepID=UPI003CCC101A